MATKKTETPKDVEAKSFFLDLPPKALASVAAQLLKQEGHVIKDPAGRIAQSGGVTYICDPGEEPGTVIVKIERDEARYRLAIERMDAAEAKEARAKLDLDATEKAVKVAKKAGNQKEVDKHQARCDHLQSEIDECTAQVLECAKDCPEAWYERLRTRAERWEDQAKTYAADAAKKIADADAMEKQGKPSDDKTTWDDKLVAMADGARDAAKGLTAKAKQALEKADGFRAQMPDTGGFENLVTRHVVRLTAVEV